MRGPHGEPPRRCLTNRYPCGELMAIVLFVDFAVSMGHFDTGAPPDDQALLDTGIWVVAVGGSILGTLAALRVRDKIRPTAR